MDDVFARGRHFLRREGRLLERRVFAALFENAPVAGVLDALRGFRNGDGGFGHGLEPDKRCPDSLPLDVEVAFQTMVAVDAVDPQMVTDACGFLESVSAADGSVSLGLPGIEGYPRAEHWTEWTYQPGLNPTAGLVGLLHQMGVAHPWRERATAYCWQALAAALPDDAHAFSEALVFLEHVDDRGRAGGFDQALADQLPRLAHYRAEADDASYGVTPLHLAPTPDSPWRHLFTDGVIDAHLDRLAHDQQADGGWTITWEPPGVASTLEWRGMETLRALQVLRAYGAGGRDGWSVS